MPSFGVTLKKEIRRIASREVKKALRSLKRVQRRVRLLHLTSRGQKRGLSSLDQRVRRLKARVSLRALSAATRSVGKRMAPTAIRALRHRLKMTRLQFSKLVGVSPGSIFGWESGRTVPRRASLARILSLRGRASSRKAKAPRRARRRGRTRRRK